MRGDPLADAAVEALEGRSLAEQESLVDRLLSWGPGDLPEPLLRLQTWLLDPPVWLDMKQANAGGEVILRAGFLSGLVLAFKSLVVGYCSPAGNKPLMFSGRLGPGGDVTRRLAETARFVEAVSQAQGMRFGEAGLRATVRVRLMHAKIRRRLLAAPEWKSEAWGLPINQYDMAGTALLFSAVVVEGLRQLGATISSDEEEAVLHQWRYVGRLMGVDDELLATSALEARTLGAMIDSTQGLPDADSRALTDALIRSGAENGRSPAEIDFGYALCRHLIGARYADAMGLPRGKWDLAPPILSRVVSGVDTLAQRLPGARTRGLQLGARYWRQAVERVFGNKEVVFALERSAKAVS